MGGSLEGQEDRNRSQIEHIDETADLLAKVKPDVMMLGAHREQLHARPPRRERAGRAAHRPAWHAGRDRVRERGRGARCAGRKRIALGAPYTEAITLKGKALLEEHGFAVVRHGILENVTNIVR